MGIKDEAAGKAAEGIAKAAGTAITRRGALEAAAAAAGGAALHGVENSTDFIKNGIENVSRLMGAVLAAARGAGYEIHTNYEGMPPCSIKLRDSLMLKDAEIWIASGHFGIGYTYLQVAQDSWPGGIGAWTGEQFKSINYTADDLPRDSSHTAVPGHIVFSWKSNPSDTGTWIGIDEDGEPVNIHVDVTDIKLGLQPGGWGWTAPHPFISTRDGHWETVCRQNEFIQCNFTINISKATNGTLAAGTYLMSVDDIDSAVNFPWNRWEAEEVVLMGGFENDGYRKIYFNTPYYPSYISTRSWNGYANNSVIASNYLDRGNGGDSLDMMTGFCAPAPASFSFASIGSNFHTSFLRQLCYPVKLVNTLEHVSGDVPLSDGSYTFDDPQTGSHMRTMGANQAGDLSPVNMVAGVDQRSMWQVTATGGGVVKLSPLWNLCQRLDWWGQLTPGKSVGTNYNGKYGAQYYRIKDAGNGLFRILPAGLGGGTYDGWCLARLRGSIVLSPIGGGAGDAPGSDLWRIRKVDAVSLAELPQPTATSGDRGDISLAASVNVYDAGNNRIGVARLGDDGTGWLETQQMGMNFWPGYFHFALDGNSVSSALVADTATRWIEVTSSTVHWDVANISMRFAEGSCALRKVASTRKGHAFPDGTYRLAITKTDGAMCLDVSWDKPYDLTTVQLYSWHAGDGQLWQLTNLDDGTVRLSPVSNQLAALDVTGGATANGSQVSLWTWIGSASQRWRIDGEPGGQVTLSPAVAPDKHLDVNGGTFSNGSRIQIYEDTTGNGIGSQYWTLELVDDAGRVMSPLRGGAYEPGDVAGAEYGLFDDAACTKQVGRFEVAKGGEEAPLTDLAGKEMVLRADRVRYVKETKAPASGNFVMDGRVRRVLPSRNAGGRFLIEVSDLATTVTVHFMVVDENGDPVEIHTGTIKVDGSLKEGDGNFQEAERKFKVKWPGKVWDHTDKWYQGNENHPDPDKKKFEDIDKVETETWVWAKLNWGSVRFFANSDPAPVYTVDKVIAGTMFTLPSAVATEKANAASPFCNLDAAYGTEASTGFLGWFSDAALTEPAPAEFEMEARTYDIFGRSRLTARFAYAAGSATSDTAADYRVAPREDADAYEGAMALPDFTGREPAHRLPAPVSATTDGTRAAAAADVDLPAIGDDGPAHRALYKGESFRLTDPATVFRYMGSHRWRSYRFEGWYTDEAATAPAAAAQVPTRDQTLYAKWVESTVDGVVTTRE